MQVQIEIGRNEVTVEGWTVMRPSRLSPSQWRDFWEAAVEAKSTASELAEKNEKLEETIAERDGEIHDLMETLAEIKTLAK